MSSARIILVSNGDMVSEQCYSEASLPRMRDLRQQTPRAAIVARQGTKLLGRRGTREVRPSRGDHGQSSQHRMAYMFAAGRLRSNTLRVPRYSKNPIGPNSSVKNSTGDISQALMSRSRLSK